MNAEIISIGDELLIGQVVNTNAAMMGEMLSGAGVRVDRVTTVGDSIGVILAAFDQAFRSHDVVIATGGLGPTSDDKTRDAVLSFFRTSLTFSEEVFSDIARLLASQKRSLTDAHRDQAMVPASARILPNAHGTAPGYHFEVGKKHFFVTPGVPYEMHGMMTASIVPLLQAAAGEFRHSITLLTTGLPESLLARRLEPVEQALRDATLAYLPSPLGVRLRITSWSTTPDEARARAEETRDAILQRIRQYVYGEGDGSLEAAVGSLLREQRKTIAVAESCTGGMIADRITNVPGSSDYFLHGAVTYSNESKTALLGVPADLIARHGAVSGEVARAMAGGIQRSSGASLGISTTGIAGPSGGSEEKPIGLVWIGLADGSGAQAFRFHFGPDRLRIKQRASQTALDIARRHLSGLPLHPPAPDETPGPA